MIYNALATAHRAALRAFTLVEVMLAAVIIALGVLGLTALFAGAAKTQVDTARLTRSAQLMERAANVARSRFVSVAKGRLNPQFAYNIDQYAGGITVPGVPSVWHAFSAYQERNDQSHPSHALTVDPSINPTTGSLQAFLVVETPEVVLYEDPLATVSGGRILPANYEAAMIPVALFSMLQDRKYDASQIQTSLNPFWTAAGFSRIRPIPFSRLEPGSVRVRFEIARQGPEDTSLRVLSRRSVVVSDAAFADDPDDVNVPDEDGLPMAVGVPDGIFSADRSAWMLFDRGLDPRGGFQMPGATEPRARLVAFGLRLQPKEWVERIVLEPAQRRSDRLLTLEERVSANGDGTYSGVGAFWRRARDGGHELGLISYEAEPTSSGATTPFIPPESGPVAERLLRRVTLTLDYDQGAQRFYLETNQNDRAFALATGQILLIAGDGSNPDAQPNEPGGESFVRIVRTVVGQAGRVRGYIDLPPKDRGAPLIWPNGYGAATGLGQTLPSSRVVDAWALAPQVRSLSPDARTWRIRPVDFRVIDLR